MKNRGDAKQMLDSDIKPGNNTRDFSAGIQRADKMGAFLVSLPKWAAWAIIAWQIRLSIEALTGKYAFPSFLTRFWRQASLWEVACWAGGMLCLAFGLYNRHLLRRQTARNLDRLNSIEKRLRVQAAGDGNEN
jgi:hypothetical protein